MSVDQLLELLAQLPPDIPVQAEGCDCVNDVKGVGLYRLGPDNRDGPRCILVADPGPYGVLGPVFTRGSGERTWKNSKGAERRSRVRVKVLRNYLRMGGI